mmetsp:Transcript_20616/g.62079  ORF Transcript_20616/g.62079 Transcript_20616/m.62079 type:complete len:210 (-) Transcript_20616:2270-2899(-)
MASSTDGRSPTVEPASDPRGVRNSGAVSTTGAAKLDSAAAASAATVSRPASKATAGAAEVAPVEVLVKDVSCRAAASKALDRCTIVRSPSPASMVTATGDAGSGPGRADFWAAAAYDGGSAGTEFLSEATTGGTAPPSLSPGALLVACKSAGTSAAGTRGGCESAAVGDTGGSVLSVSTPSATLVSAAPAECTAPACCCSGSAPACAAA